MSVEDEEILSTTGYRPPKYRKELRDAPLTTGNGWRDLVEAVKLIDPVQDTRDLTEIPCARKSLMAGISAGGGIGLVRGLTVGPFAASNWAMGTFFIVCGSSFWLCASRHRMERGKAEAIQQAMDDAAKARATQAARNRERAAQEAMQQKALRPAEEEKSRGSWWTPWR
ncbi:hypothetical protein BKA62DRAFT_696551 [Auriculariales sp. MPI-PUGE-AT-0066]|nr:hypothetical protein BKA62DRAFT_696551 [Auriculariales sp. MPI-PUGE-AT-0066]